LGVDNREVDREVDMCLIQVQEIVVCTVHGMTTSCSCDCTIIVLLDPVCWGEKIVRVVWRRAVFVVLVM
jgi:hypothetical protein